MSAYMSITVDSANKSPDNKMKRKKKTQNEKKYKLDNQTRLSSNNSARQMDAKYLSLLHNRNILLPMPYIFGPKIYFIIIK